MLNIMLFASKHLATCLLTKSSKSQLHLITFLTVLVNVNPCCFSLGSLLTVTNKSQPVSVIVFLNDLTWQFDRVWHELAGMWLEAASHYLPSGPAGQSRAFQGLDHQWACSSFQPSRD